MLPLFRRRQSFSVADVIRVARLSEFATDGTRQMLRTKFMPREGYERPCRSSVLLCLRLQT
jgi:hypothetical protein